ncbi:MAG: type IX secretion system plug protein domain-containing protein, partial [Bacteroidales bacterium]
MTKVIITPIQAQEISDVYKDRVFDDSIKTVRIHQSGWEISYPFYELNSDKQLVLSFDDLCENSRDFQYRIIHCDQNWSKSNLFFNEYIDGLETNYIDDYDMSVNTFIPYTHYELKLPNDDIDFRISGNYVVEVYETSQPERVLFVKRFMVNEHKIKINAEVRQPVVSLYRSLGQDVKFSLETKGMEFNNMYDDLDVCIVQNYQWETAQSDFSPDFVNNDEIVFHRDDQAVFKAINEYRRFSIRELKYTDSEVEAINFECPDYYVRLVKD